MIERLTQAHTDGKISDTAYKNAKKWLTDQEFLPFREQLVSLIQKERFDENLTMRFMQLDPLLWWTP